ncbi:hypothetical protein CPB85DRAFT_1349684 [Mucidula mucida]|nr:hypothetical protein CPB85DRAFT_1349684 [Mucidula mucida]
MICRAVFSSAFCTGVNIHIVSFIASITRAVLAIYIHIVSLTCRILFADPARVQRAIATAARTLYTRLIHR